MAAGHAPLRRAALLVLAAFAVHQLRFLVTYGSDAGRVLNEPGHRYLPFAAAAAGVLVIAAAAQFGASLIRLAHGRATVSSGPRRLPRLWAENAAILIAIYVTQEGLEGAFTPGHPIWSHGGWIVVPLAVIAGGLVAVLLVGAHRALVEVGRRGTHRGLPKALDVSAPRPPEAVLAPVDAIARHLAGRAPPRCGVRTSF